MVKGLYLKSPLENTVIIENKKRLVMSQPPIIVF